MFHVKPENPAHRPQFVVISADHSHLCSCLLVANSGFVCRHYFAAMQAGVKCTYHISLVLRRWFQNSKQSMANFDEWITAQPRLVATKHEKDFPATLHGSTSQNSNSLVALLASVSTVPALDNVALTRQQRFADLNSIIKETIAKASTDQDLYLSTKAAYSVTAKEVNAAIEYKDGGSQTRGIKDPLARKSKGQPRNTRLKASGEKTKKKAGIKTERKRKTQKEKEVPKKQLKRNEAPAKEKGKERKKEVPTKQAETKTYSTRLASKQTVGRKQKRKVNVELEEKRQSKRLRIKE